MWYHAAAMTDPQQPFVSCAACGEQTPPGNYCVRCGAPLEGHEGPSRRRAGFAAAPHEHAHLPMPVSTLYPHLPRASMLGFHAALAGGAALVVILAAFRLFPVALIAAAVLLPLVTLIYLYDIDVYEEEPGWAITCTLVWGIATGVGVALLARGVLPTGAALIDKHSTNNVVTGGILIPALGTLCMLAGPLLLIRSPRFREVLDGANFGVVTAVAFTGAEAVVYGFHVLGQGVRPSGAAAPWIWRLLSISIAEPVLAMGAIGFATAAIWFRFRAHPRDPAGMHAFGHPVVAVVLAFALTIGGAIGETFLPAGAWLAWLVAFDLVALWLLRRTLHIALLEEAADIEIGPPFTCANCGATTPRHTFCSNCGVSLRAMPKARNAPPAPEVQRPAPEGGT
jgi:ribosomal protein L32